MQKALLGSSPASMLIRICHVTLYPGLADTAGMDGPTGTDSARRLGIIATLLVGVAFGGWYNNASGGWGIQNPGIPSVRDVCAASATEVFAIGGDAIAKTDDGGITWQTILSGFGVVSKCAFPAPNVGWVTRSTTSILHWDGSSFLPQDAGTVEWPYAVFALTSSNVWACTLVGEVAATADGFNWTLVGQIPSGATCEAIFFTSVSTGYAGDNQGSLWKSADGGATWSFLAGGPSRTRITSIYCLDALACYAAGEDAGTGIVLTTSDGGATWSSLPVPPATIYYDTLCFAPSTCWIVGYPGVTAVTFDSGATWREYPVPSGVTLLGSDFASPDLGYVAVQEGFIHKFTNDAPVANAGSDQAVFRNVLVSLNGTGSSDLDTDPLTYLWIQVGGPAVTLTGATTATATFTPSQLGMYTFNVTVDDGFGGTAPDQVVITVANRAPMANAGADFMARKATTVDLDGSQSTDPDLDSPLTYTWAQVTGPAVTLNNANNAITNFTPPQVGLYNFSLAVDDGHLNGVTTDYVEVTVWGLAPVANLTGPTTGATGASLSFSGGNSTDADGMIDTYVFTWGDGSTPTSGVSPNAAHAWTTAGTYPVNLTVTDNDGNVSAADTLTVAISAANTAPIAAIAVNPASGTIPTRFAFNGSGSQDAQDPDAALNFTWNFGDGRTGYGITASHSYTSRGTLTVTLTVRDQGGLTGTITISVTVANRAPTVDAGPDQSVGVNKQVTLSGSGTDPDGDALTYTWVQTAGPPLTFAGAGTAEATFTPTEIGTYKFRLAVNDGQAANTTALDTVTITVTKAEVFPWLPVLIALIIVAVVLVLVLMMRKKKPAEEEKPIEPEKGEKEGQTTGDETVTKPDKSA